MEPIRTMLKKIWAWLNQARYFDANVPRWLYRVMNAFYKRMNRESLAAEARIRMEKMKEEMLRKRIQDYYETVSFGKVDIPPFILAEKEIARLKRTGDFQTLVSKALEDEVA